jgi:hypothetical protein
MKKIHMLMGIGAVLGLILSIGACVMVPAYDPSGGYYGGPNLVIQDPPLFIYPPSLGFFAAIGIPYDLFYIDRYYYLHHGENWYRSSRYNGPWGSMKYDYLPQGLRNHRYDDIVRGRDHEYRTYRKESNRYQGRSFRPERYESPNRGGESRDGFRRR